LDAVQNQRKIQQGRSRAHHKGESSSMTQIVVDSETRDQLCGLVHPAELLDRDGRVLGRFLPAADLTGYEPLQPQVGEGELGQRSRQGGGRPLTEILADLEKRT
jgi:hypothetical protein